MRKSQYHVSILPKITEKDLAKMFTVSWGLRKLSPKQKQLKYRIRTICQDRPWIAKKMVARPAGRWRTRSILGGTVDSWLVQPRLLAITSHITTISRLLPNVDEKLWASHPKLGWLQFGILWGMAPQSTQCPGTQKVLRSVLSQGICQKPKKGPLLPRSSS